MLVNSSVEESKVFSPRSSGLFPPGSAVNGCVGLTGCYVHGVLSQAAWFLGGGIRWLCRKSQKNSSEWRHLFGGMSLVLTRLQVEAGISREARGPPG